MSTTTSKIAPRTHADQLRLPGLEVHPADDARARARVVVLHEIVENPERPERVTAVGLLEEAARILMDHVLDQHGACEASLDRKHRGQSSQLFANPLTNCSPTR